MAKEQFLKLHSFLPVSRANGPGSRAVVWVQGCSLGCPGCFNPQTHSFGAGELISVRDVFHQIAGLQDRVEGITISGGEPLQQRAAVTALLRRIKEETSLTAILFTGFSWDEVMRMEPRVANDETSPTETLLTRNALPVILARNRKDFFSACPQSHIEDARTISSPSPQPSPLGRGRNDSANGNILRSSDFSETANVIPSPWGEGQGEGKGNELQLSRPESQNAPNAYEVETGSSRDRCESGGASSGPDFLRYVDVLIAGRYDSARPVGRGMLGSANKSVHFLTERYDCNDLASVPEAEIIITDSGELLLSGIHPVRSQNAYDF